MMLETIIQEVNAVAWGLPMLILLLGTGIYLTLGLGFMTLRKVPRAVSLLFSGVSGRGEGDIVPFKALMTSLSATIGTGNIAGVATAITLGGPGALFWMWITALFGMVHPVLSASAARNSSFLTLLPVSNEPVRSSRLHQIRRPRPHRSDARLSR